jgi:hypothetical protein
MPSVDAYAPQNPPPPVAPGPAYQQGTAQMPQYPGPAYGDQFQAQASAPPTMSGPPAMDPMSGPGYGAPYSGLPYDTQPKPKRSVAVPVFAALTVLFFLATAVLTGLYITKNSAFNRKSNDVKARDAAISTKDGQISDLNKQLTDLKNQLDQAGQKQSGTENQLNEITREKQVIANCLTLLVDAITAANKGDSATAQSKAQQAEAPCNEAQKYLD